MKELVGSYNICALPLQLVAESHPSDLEHSGYDKVLYAGTVEVSFQDLVRLRLHPEHLPANMFKS